MCSWMLTSSICETKALNSTFSSHNNNNNAGCRVLTGTAPVSLSLPGPAASWHPPCPARVQRLGAEDLGGSWGALEQDQRRPPSPFRAYQPQDWASGGPVRSPQAMAALARSFLCPGWQPVHVALLGPGCTFLEGGPRGAGEDAVSATHRMEAGRKPGSPKRTSGTPAAPAPPQHPLLRKGPPPPRDRSSLTPACLPVFEPSWPARCERRRSVQGDIKKVQRLLICQHGLSCRPAG